MRKQTGTITVTTDWTEINPNFNINFWSVYPIDGDITVERFYEYGWGNSTNTDSGEILHSFYCCLKIRIKAQAGSVTLNYSINGSASFDSMDSTIRVTANYTVVPEYSTIFCDSDGGAFNTYLPAGVEGAKCRIINSGSSGNDITVVPNGADLLDGLNESKGLSDGSVLDLIFNSIEGWK